MTGAEWGAVIGAAVALAGALTSYLKAQAANAALAKHIKEVSASEAQKSS